MIETVAALGGMWLLGWLKKHKTKLDHKTWGPVVNVALGTVATAAIGGEVPTTGAALAETIRGGLVLGGLAELGHAGAKTATRVRRQLNGGQRE